MLQGLNQHIGYDPNHEMCFCYICATVVFIWIGGVPSVKKARQKAIYLTMIDENYIPGGNRLTCISGSIPFPNMAAIIDMEVNALKSFDDDDFAKE